MDRSGHDGEKSVKPAGTEAGRPVRSISCQAGGDGGLDQGGRGEGKSEENRFWIPFEKKINLDGIKRGVRDDRKICTRERMKWAFPELETPGRSGFGGRGIRVVCAC